MENKPNPAGFTAFVISKVKDKAMENSHKNRTFRAVMSRAANPAFESAAWEYLIPYCDIEKDFQRIPFALVGAAIAGSRPEANGTDDIGTAFRKICKDQEDKDREGKRFRRLIACDSVLELCPVLRPILSYLASKGVSLDYTMLLNDLLFWNQKTKLRWTVNFYQESMPDETEAES